MSNKPLAQFDRKVTRQLYERQVINNLHVSTHMQKQSSVITTDEPDNESRIIEEDKPLSVYKFYLLQMFGHLDCPNPSVYSVEFYRQQEEIKRDERDEEVHIAFEFDFEICENLTDAQMGMQCWDTNQFPTQHIYISADRTKLLEIVNTRVAVIYNYDEDETQDVLDKDGNYSHKKVFWHKEHVIKRFPRYLQSYTSANFLFSNNFTYYLDFDFQCNQIVIMETATQKRFCPIPSDMLNFNNERDVKDAKQIPEIGKRICFYKYAEENLIRIINSDNVDCIFQFTREGMKLLSYVKIDNQLQQESSHHIMQQMTLYSDQTLSRFVRKVQNYKSVITHDANRKNKPVRDLLDQLYSIDYSQPWDSTSSVFISELSFSIYNWKIAERLIHEDGFDLRQVDRFSALELLFCIFPKSQTILHKLCNNKDPDSSQFMAKQISDLFALANTPLALKSEIFAEGTTFEVPFLLNSDGCTPIDLALGINSRADISEEKKKQSASEDQFVDLELARIVLKNLKNAQFLNQGQFVVDSIISCIEEEVPGIGEYLDSRFKKISSMPGNVQNEMNDDVQDVCKETDYGVIQTEAWTSTGELKRQMYVADGWNEQYNNFFFDIPALHDQGPQGFKFIQALEKIESVKIYSYKSIQMLINYHWKNWQAGINMMRFIPFTVLLIIFTLWSNYILVHSHGAESAEEAASKSLRMLLDEAGDSDDLMTLTRFRRADIAFCILLIICSSFFLITEIESFIDQPRKYLASWKTNLFDVSPLILLYVNTARSIRNPGRLNYSFWVVQSITAFLIWLKFIWFLRSQEFFAYLIRSLVETVNDIQAFFIILIITCVGFADSFLSLSRSMENGFVENYYRSLRFSWLFVLGQNEQIEGVDVYGDILYFIASIILLIIMLNVLIALAGKSLERAADNRIEYAYKEKVQLLNELQRSSLMRSLSYLQRKGPEKINNNLLFVSFVDDVREDAENEEAAE